MNSVPPLGHILRGILKVPRSQAGNLLRALRGYPVSLPSFGSMTLDNDDVQLAKAWLKKRSQWHDEHVVRQYESEFARWNGSKSAFAFMGGRVALSACIAALGLKPDDDIVVPGYTCVVVVNACEYAHVNPVYVDIELDTYGIDADQLERQITPKTRAIVLQHLYGLVCRDYERILEIANNRKLRVIEDCAHATGAVFKGQKVGTRGAVGFYSSEQSKVFTTIQGGIAVTNDEQVAEGIRAYYDKVAFPDDAFIDALLHTLILNFYRCKHPQRWLLGNWAEILHGNKRLASTTPEEERGICPANYARKMPAPVAALGMNQVRKIDRYNSVRRETAKRWDTWCDVHGYRKPLVIEGSVPVFLRYPVLVEEHRKQDRSWAYRELGIDLGLWFVTNAHPAPRPIHGCPNADTAVKRCVNLPCLEA